MYDVKGKRAIITGASQGFGKEFARRLADQGCKVCMSDITEDVGNKARDEIKKKYGLKDDSICFVKCDVSKKEDWTKLWDEAERILGGKIDIFCNNAGVGPSAGWETGLAVMSTGFTRGVFMAIERMGRSKGGSGGRIVNTASCAGLTVGGLGSIDGVGYNISKWGNVAVTRSFELAKPSPYDVEGIKAYALCPWFADTAMVRSGVGSVGSGNKDVSDLERKTGHRILTVEEVGDSLMESFRLDKNGAVYVIFPDVPLIEYPNIRNRYFYFQIFLAKIAAKLNLNVLTPAQTYVIAFLLIWIFFCVFNKVLGCILGCC